MIPPISRRFAVAPMMDYTDRHARYFLRLVAPDVLLYTEMITTGAILHGDKEYILQYNPEEHPVALQLGGSDPEALAECAAIAESKGYDEVNLNAGCPSPRVSKGRFGACLMLEPELVAECLSAMQSRVKIPVTLKCRIGVDNQDSYEALSHFIKVNAETGCQTFIIHARKAWLKGLSPKQNREIPPLQYDVAAQLKRDFPNLNIMVNGGIANTQLAQQLMQWADGIMIGRAAFSNPYFLAELQQLLYPERAIRTRQEIIEAFLPYVTRQLEKGTKLTALTRHILGLFQGLPGAANWRRTLSEGAHRSGSDISLIQTALARCHPDVSRDPAQRIAKL